jgi:hypothetical protein
MTSSTISFIGNNQNLINLLSKYFQEKKLNPVNFNSQEPPNYLIFVFNSNQNINTFEIENYFSNINSKTKITVIFQVSQFDNFNQTQQLVKLSENLIKKKLDIRTLLVYDLVSTAENLPLSTLDQILKNSIQKQIINISRNGNLKLFPLSFSDFCEGVSRSLFLSNTANQTFYLAGSSISDIDLALNLKKILTKNNLSLEINQNLNISPSFDPEDKIDSSLASLNWLPKENTDNFIETAITFPKIAKPKTVNIQNFEFPIFNFQISEKINKFKPPSVIHLLLGITGISLTLYLIIFIGFAISLIISVNHAKLAYENIRQGNLSQSIKFAESSSRKLETAENFYQLSSLPIKTILPNFNTSFRYLISTLGHANQLTINFHRLYSLSNSFYQDSLSGVDVDVKNFSSTLSNQLESFQTELNQLLLTNQPEQLDQIKFLTIPENLKNENLNLLKNQVSQTISLSKILPLVLVENKITYYLILIQDNNELRPSGGYLNTYALLTLENNKPIDLKIDPTLRLNSQILGQIEPPKNISLLTGNTQWNFSDANYSPHFPETAKQISWFYEKITGIKVNGIISLNLSFFEKYLKYNQPLNLDNQEINSDNLRLILADPEHNHSEDILTKLTTKIFNDVKSQNTSLAAFSRAFLDTSLSGDINLWLSDQVAESLIATTNISGEIRNLSCPPQFSHSTCLSETFYFNEGNYSINKSNFYSKRHLSHLVDLNKDKITHHISVDYSYKNPVPNNTNLQYRALIRFYAPQNSSINQITFDSQVIDQNTILTNNKYGLLEIEFPLNFFLNQNHKLEIILETNQKLSLVNGLTSYALNLYKQPGIQNTTTQVNINFPDNLSPKIISQEAQSLRQNLAFPIKNSANETYAVAFSGLSR